MTDWQFIIVAALLGWIAIQAWVFRVEERARHIFLLERQDRADLDDELKRMCPNVFDVTTREELREWQAVFIRKHEYFERRKNTLLDPHSDEPSSWGDMYFMLSGLRERDDESDFEFPARSNDDERRYLEECRGMTDAFIAKAQAQTKLTGPEISFYCYSRWKDAFLERGVWRKPSKIDAELFEMSFKSTLERYTATAHTGVSGS
jgi:hypothetical protein